MSRLDVHYSSKTPEWSTPQDFFDELHAEFRFTLDPCSTHDNAKTPRHFTAEEDGLGQPWGQEIVFMNPPYGRGISEWIEKAYYSAENGATVVCLVPARTDTAWWHDYCAKGEVRFVRGRLKFGGGTSPAPFPSAVVIFRPSFLSVLPSPESGGYVRTDGGTDGFMRAFKAAGIKAAGK